MSLEFISQVMMLILAGGMFVLALILIFGVIIGIVCEFFPVSKIGKFLSTFLYKLKRMFDPVKNDIKLKKEAKEGKIILMTFEQYLAVHLAAPEEYKLSKWAVTGSYGTKIRLLSKDVKKLEKYLKNQENQKYTDMCVEELEHIRALLNKRIEKLTDENAKVVEDMLEQTVEMVSSQLGG